MKKMNTYDLSFSSKTSLNMGAIVPIGYQMTLPKDNFKINPVITVRFSPMVAAVLGLFKLKFRIHHIKLRDIWTNFEKYYSGKGSISHPYKTLDKSWTATGSTLIEYLGAGRYDTSGNEDINMLLYRAYQKIYYDKYLRVDTATDPDDLYEMGDGADTGTSEVVQQDFYDVDILSRMVQQQFYSTAPQISSTPFDVTDVQNLLAESKHSSILRKFIYNAKEYMKQVIGIDDENYSDNAKVVHASDTFFTFNEITNTALSASYPLGVSQSLIQTSTNDGEITFDKKIHGDEFGILMYTISVIPITSDYQGSHKEILKPLSNKEYWNPIYENLGNVAVLGKECCTLNASANNTIGYTPIYNNYRHGRNFWSSEFQTTYNTQILRRSNVNTPAAARVITKTDYDYLFDSYSMPQIRAFAYNKVMAQRQISKVVDPINLDLNNISVNIK